MIVPYAKTDELFRFFVSAFCIYMMLTYGLVVCNIGSLYRLRYVYITTLAAVGIAGFIAFFEDIKIFEIGKILKRVFEDYKERNSILLEIIVDPEEYFI